MSTPDDIHTQQELLKTSRAHLHELLLQQQTMGIHTPAYVNTEIHRYRADIARYKTVLRAWGLSVDDHPDDEAQGNEPPEKISTIPQGRNHKELFSELKEWKVVHRNIQKLLLNMYSLESIVKGIEAEITETAINQIRDTWFAFCRDDIESIVSEFNFVFIKQDRVLKIKTTLGQEPDFSTRIRSLSTRDIESSLSLKWSIISLRRQLEEILTIADIFIVRIVEDLEREMHL